LITDQDIHDALVTYLLRCPEDRAALAEPVRLTESGATMTERTCLPTHVTASALLIDDQDRLLVIRHLVYGLELQPGGHLEPDDADLPGAALRELAEETGIAPELVALAATEPGYAICHRVPPSAAKAEPAHHHLDFGFLFTTTHPYIGAINTAEVASAAWRPRTELPGYLAERLARAVRLLDAPAASRACAVGGTGFSTLN
jgi:8-oxo-dGTP pyrophosphatase MutT (NUDIX family)